jgi:methylenetetrahydrofolate reductase (NADPH)
VDLANLEGSADALLPNGLDPKVFNQERSVSSPNPIREALINARFCYMSEIVASSRSPESRILDVASQLARIPEVVGGSITNNAGGVPGHDPVRIAAAVKARGLTPNVHVTCVRRDRIGLRKMLQEIHSMEIENVFAMTGDYPKSDPAAGVFDLDSVQLVRMMDELRQAGNPYWIAVAVSPFKYAEPDCVYQYLKLKKKIAAGADYAITQLGYDAGKFRELKRYVDDNIGPFPMLGNVYVLNSRAAEEMVNGEIPGCWVSPSLRKIVKTEAQDPDKGRMARLERGARMVAILRGLGYAGAYLGGTHDPGDIRWIIQRAESLQHKWEELAEELTFAPERAFYLYKSSSSTSANRGIVPRLLDTLVTLFPVNKENGLRRMLSAILGWVDRKPSVAHALERFETAVKTPLFGCQSCGNCVLGSMEYVCPQTCPKQMRNGPCGGTKNDGTCEVVEKPCIWASVYERAKAANELDRLGAFIPPPDRGLKGTSSWINYFLNRDVRADAFQPLRVLSGTKPAARVAVEPPLKISPARKSDLVPLNTETGPKQKR